MRAPIKHIPELSEEEQARFWSKVAITADNGKCWEWQAHRGRKGYGTFKIRGRSFLSNRVAFSMSKGVLPPERPFACHTCDNPSCCNPNHLFAGSPKDNMQDKIMKKRPLNLPSGDQHFSVFYPEKVKRGEELPTTKLTSDQVKEIRDIYAAGTSITQRELASRFGVKFPTISMIVNRKTWKHVA